MSSVTPDVTVPGPLAGPAGGKAARTAPVQGPGRPIRSWPLLALAVPAAAEVWSGWVGIAQQTGFGMIAPLPGIWPSLHLDTAVSLPVGVEAYAAYALRAWLAREPWISARTRRFAKWSAICSFTLGMAGQIAYHLLAQAGAARAPWPVTTLVSCLPVLVLAMGTALAHMIRADMTEPDQLGTGTAGPAALRTTDQPQPDQPPAREDHLPGGGPLARPGRPPGTGQSPPMARAQDRRACRLNHVADASITGGREPSDCRKNPKSRLRGPQGGDSQATRPQSRLGPVGLEQVGVHLGDGSQRDALRAHGGADPGV